MRFSAGSYMPPHLRILTYTTRPRHAIREYIALRCSTIPREPPNPPRAINTCAAFHARTIVCGWLSVLCVRPPLNRRACASLLPNRRGMASAINSLVPFLLKHMILPMLCSKPESIPATPAVGNAATLLVNDLSVRRTFLASTTPA